jgi:hypothetical protein
MTPAEQRLQQLMALYGVSELPDAPADDDDTAECWQAYEDQLAELPRPIVQALSDLMAVELASEGVTILPVCPDDPDPDDFDPGGGHPARAPPGNGKRAALARCDALSDTEMETTFAENTQYERLRQEFYRGAP